MSASQRWPFGAVTREEHDAQTLNRAAAQSVLERRDDAAQDGAQVYISPNGWLWLVRRKGERLAVLCTICQRVEFDIDDLAALDDTPAGAIVCDGCNLHPPDVLEVVQRDNRQRTVEAVRDGRATMKLKSEPKAKTRRSSRKS